MIETGLYKHFKGKMYSVICELENVSNTDLEAYVIHDTATHSETLKHVVIYEKEGKFYHTVKDERLILYRALYDDNLLCVRPSSMFDDLKEFYGQLVPRFRKI